jgi:adenine deaminase
MGAHAGDGALVPGPRGPVGDAPGPAGGDGRAYGADHLVPRPLARPLVPSTAELNRLRRVALGDEDADLAVRGGTVVVVQTGEMLPRDVLVVGRFIAAVTPHGVLDARRTLDAGGLYVLPGYLAWLRIEHTLLQPGELARLVIPRGTTTVLARPPTVMGGLGPAGIDLLTTTTTPLRIIVQPGDGGPGYALPAGPSTRTVADLAARGHAGGDVARLVDRGARVADAVRMATLTAARRAGLDHAVGSVSPTRLADLQLVEQPAGPLPPERVITAGRIAAERGRPLFDNLDVVPDWAHDTVRVAAGLCARSFAVPAGGAWAWVQAAELVPEPPAVSTSWVCLTRAFHAQLPVSDGVVVTDPARDVIKIAVVDRHEAREAVGAGFVRGFGLTRGALAATTNDENGNLVVVGVTDDDMLTAVRALEGMGGGFVAVDRGWVRAACPLSVAGIASDTTWETALEALREVNAVAAELGCRLPAPFRTLAFTGRTDVGDLGLTERGLVDVAAAAPAPVVLPMVAGRPTCRCPAHTSDVHRLFDRDAIG